ncbi:MAG TPA: hypothetical protein VHS06_00395, partial [Chloroflexota bacterium]|nr:hypothetical protein [Chloroflexota bacterium]
RPQPTPIHTNCRAASSGDRRLIVTKPTDTSIRTMGSALGYAGDQIRGHPLITGSVVLAMAGAFIGSRIAQARAMRRQKSPLQRAQDLMGPIGFMALAAIARQRMRARGKGMAASALGISGPIMESLPNLAIQRRRRVGAPNAIRQAGYALSLIPVTIAFLRNPLVRDMGFRMMSRRIGRR